MAKYKHRQYQYEAQSTRNIPGRNMSAVMHLFFSCCGETIHMPGCTCSSEWLNVEGS